MASLEEKYPVSEQIVTACFKPKKYKELIDIEKKQFVKYVIIMMLVLATVSFAIPTASIIAGFGGFGKLFTEIIPELKVTEEGLYCEEPYKLKLNQYRLVIDTREDIASDDMIEDFGMYIAVGRTTIRLCTNIEGKVYNYRTFYIDHLLYTDFVNEDLQILIPPLYITFVLTFIASAIVSFIRYGLLAWLLASLLNISNQKSENVLPFKKLFRICFYAQTFGMIFTNFNDALGQPIPFVISEFIDVMVMVYLLRVGYDSARGMINDDEN